MPDINKSFIIETNASKISIGGKLAQRNNVVGGRPVAYYSYALNSAE